MILSFWDAIFPGGGYVKLPGGILMQPSNSSKNKHFKISATPETSDTFLPLKISKVTFVQPGNAPGRTVWWDHSAPTTGHLHSPASIALILLGETARMHCNKSRRQEGSTKHLMRICRQHILRIFHYCKSKICEKPAHFTVINTSNLFKERRNRCPKLIKTSTPNTKSNISKATPFQEIFQPTICGGWMLPKHA